MEKVHVYVIWDADLGGAAIAKTYTNGLMILTRDAAIRAPIMMGEDKLEATVFAHEIGHALGYRGHTDDPTQLMNPNGGDEFIPKRHADVVNPSSGDMP